MAYIGLIAALGSNVILAIFDKISSTKLLNRNEVLFFSFLKTLMCCLLSLLILPFEPLVINKAGVIISLFAGIFHAASVVLIMKSLKQTLTVYVNLFMSAGVLFPTIFGFFFLDQPVTILKLISLVVLILALALALNVKFKKNFGGKILIAMLIPYGFLMVMQGIFPTYCVGGSKVLFSLIMYGSSSVILGATSLFKVERIPKFKNSVYSICALCAIMNLIINILSTGLSATLDAIVVFPTVQGLRLVSIILLSPILWSEKINRMQIFGSLLAIICVCILSI